MHFAIAWIAGNLKSETNIAALYSIGVSGIQQNPGQAEQLYRSYFSSTEGKKPVCSKEKNKDTMMVKISQVLVNPSSHEQFWKAIGSGLSPLHPGSCSEVLFTETLPLRRVRATNDSQDYAQ